jgi:hypothetical protein
MVNVKKVCPFAAAAPQQENSDCLGEECACYVKLNKRRIMLAEDCSLPDQEFCYSYSGCGLVTRIPWKQVKREEKKATRQGQPRRNSFA